MAMRSMSSPAVAQPVRRGATMHRPSSTANLANATTTTSPLARLVLRSSASVPQPNPRPLSTSASTPLTSWQVVRTGVVTRASGGGGSKSVVGAASAASEEIDSGGSGGALSKTLLLGGLFALWYLFNIYFNIANKTVLKAFPFPLTCTTLQFAVGGVLALSMWGLRLHKRPELTRDALVGILPLAVVHTLGNLLTNVSLGKVAVSFTHTIKAMEPFFSVALSAAFLGDSPTLPILLSLIPVVGGVALASLSEPTFNWPGFLAAMGSNITFQSRNVLSKKLMGGKSKTAGGGKMDNINLFSIITIMSFFLLAPVTLMAEGVRFTTANMAAMGIADPSALMVRAMQAAVCFHAYQQVSYMILQRVSPVTHSIGNCVKRVVVIVASVIVFANPVTPVNAAGTALALLGVFAYSQAKRAAVADEKAAKKAE